MRRVLALVLVPAALVALAGCGAESETTGSGGRSTRSPALPFPPRAAEPATSRGHAAVPAGKVVTIGGRPEGAAVNAASGTLGIALDDRAHDFALLDPSTLEVRRTIPLPSGSRHVTAWGGRFLVPLEDTDQLAQVPATGEGEARLTKVGDGPHDAAGTSHGVLVGDEFGGTVTKVRDGDHGKTIEVDAQPGGLADAGRRRVAAISVRANTISLIDPRTLRRTGSQSAGYGPSHVVARTDDGRVFIADTRGGAILEYATRPRLKALSRLAVGTSPYGLAIDARRNRLWVTDTATDQLLELDIGGRPRLVRRYPTVRQPNTVAVDTRTGAVFVVGEAEGKLQRIEPG
ncbi:MAG: hypothetical protein J7513_11800 [Solirubrobacteraceae bacterium]|nr:hypothetical protein [Solirubrobacteraceae bacterium]